ncbi:MAG: ImmA/IrrE family metallo-endopeptidase [Bifidobacteriaceae bacterium]|jgi:Zn-dependent peptidase ImmA (M78 family)|nr:ImmA/IrrE family metallo-endopeptidase [Bifidobacteriaceae bacterium]
MTTSNEARGSQAATAMRKRFGLGTGPIADLVDLAAGADTTCDVAFEPLEPGLEGMVAQDPATGQRIILVSTGTVLTRQRFTLAHELGHLELGTLHAGQDHGGRTAQEVAADAFARHLLLPLAAVRQATPEGPATVEILSDLVRTYRVSPSVASIQLRQAHVIDQATVEAWKPLTAPWLAARFGWRDEHNAWTVQAQTRRAPRKLLVKAMDGYVKGLVSLTTLATITGTAPDVLSQELAQQGLTPEPTAITWFDPDA